MIAEISTGLSAAKTIFDLTKGLLSLRNQTDREVAVREISAKATEASVALLAAQAEITKLSEQNAELAKVNAQLREFTLHKDQYELRRHYPNTLVYAPKDTSTLEGKSIRLCTKCFKRSEYSILQPTAEKSGRETFYVCHACDSKYLMGYDFTEKDVGFSG